MNNDIIQKLREGGIPGALALIDTRIRHDDSPGSLLDAIVDLHSLYCFEEAREVTDRLLRHPETTPDQLLAVAKLLFQRGRYAEAARFTERVVKIDPDDSGYATLHASSIERSGNVIEARNLLRRTLEQHPGHGHATRLLARIDRREGDFEAARCRLEKRLREFPSDNNWRLHYELAAVLDRQSDFDGAMRALLAAKQQLAPQSAQFQQVWRSQTARQQEVARLLDRSRLTRWRKEAGDRLTPPMRICLMGGFPRSGTTLLERILTSHPDCVGTDETGVLAAQFRDPIIFGADSAETAVQELDAFEREDLSAGREEYLRCTQACIGDQVTSRLLVEKDPLLTADLAVPLRLFPEAKVLMPLRDPRDVVLSFFFTLVPLSPNSVASSTIENSGLYYAEVMDHWLRWREILDPGRWMESRYEDLIAKPEPQARKLCEFLGLHWDPRVLQYHNQPRETPVSTPTYEDVSRPLYTRSVGRWKNYRKWLEPHLPLLQPFVKTFGYDN